MMHYDFKSEKLVYTDEEMWIFLKDIYLEQRYLARVSDELLFERLDGLVINLTELHFNGERSFRVENGVLAYALVDVLAELDFREKDYAAQIGIALRRFDKHSQFHDYLALTRQLKKLTGQKCLFRFTSEKGVQALERGGIRFTLASSYKNPTFNIAVRDDELSIRHQLPNLRIVLTSGKAIPVKGDIVTRRAFDDYYIYCLSATFDLKLFTLFGADACVIIKNGDLFSQRVLNAYRNRYPEERVLFGSVEYLDPYRSLRSNKPIELTKTVEFSYEKEFRFVAFGPKSEWEKERVIHIDMNGIAYDIIRICH